MNAVQKLVAAVDRTQQGRPWLAFPVAVWKKFGDDQAGNLAALIAYYGFAALLPLLLVLVTTLDIVLKNNQALYNDVLNSAFGQIPVGKQLFDSLGSLNETGFALVIGLILTFLGARGVAGAASNALNTVWGVPFARRPGFPWSFLREIALILVVGIGLMAASLLSGLVGSGGLLSGGWAQAGAIVVGLLLNVGVAWLAFRLATAREIPARDMLPGAVLTAVLWQILQLLGRLFRLAHAEPQFLAVRHLRRGARPARLALPAGPAHPVRGGGERGRGQAAVAAQPRAATADQGRPARLPDVRADPGTPARAGHREPHPRRPRAAARREPPTAPSRS